MGPRYDYQHNSKKDKLCKREKIRKNFYKSKKMRQMLIKIRKWNEILREQENELDASKKYGDY